VGRRRRRRAAARILAEQARLRPAGYGGQASTDRKRAGARSLPVGRRGRRRKGSHILAEQTRFPLGHTHKHPKCKDLFPSPRERSEWRGGVRGGGRRLLQASNRKHSQVLSSSTNQILAEQTRSTRGEAPSPRPSSPEGGEGAPAECPALHASTSLTATRAGARRASRSPR
jgi:hypothetical protein